MKRLLSLAALSGAALFAAEASQNLLTDPGFEGKSPKWYLRAQKRPVQPDQFNFVAEKPHSGKLCVRVRDTQNNSGHYLSQDVRLPEDLKTVQLSFYVRADEPHDFAAGLLFNAGTKPDRCLGGDIRPFKAEKEWKLCKRTVHIPQGARTTNLLICPTPAQSNYPLTGTIYVDDAVFSAAPPPELTPEGLGIDREPAPRGDAPYMPADGSTVFRNPPSFTFPAVHGWKLGKHTYSIEWSRSDKFPAKETQRMTHCLYHVNIPTTILEPGKWFWRYGLELPAGKVVWSKARHFFVPADAPKLAWVPIDDLVKRISKDDFRSYIHKEDLPAIRERGRNGDLKATAELMQQRLQKKIGEKLQDEPPFLSKDPKQRTLDYVKVMRSMTFGQVKLLTAGYLMTGNPAFGQEVKRRILHFYGDWDPRGSTSIKECDEPGMHINSNCLACYEMTRELFTPEERKKVEESMRIRMNEFYDHLTGHAVDAHPYNSHAIFYYQLMGRLGLVLVHSYPEEAKRAIDYSLRYFWTYTHPFAAPDGGWSEGPAYASWGVERLCRYVHVIKMTTGLDLATIHPFFKNSGYYFLYGWPGRTRLGSFGDGSSPVGQAYTLRILAVMNQNPVFLKPGIDRNLGASWDIWSILADTKKLGTPDMSQLPLAKCFPSVGLAALRTDLGDYSKDIGFIFQSNPFGAVSHHHNSHNCFMLEAFEEPLFISSGYYDYYSSPHHGGWTRETKSRCGITVDGGKGQGRGGRYTGRITRFETGKDFDILQGDATPAYTMLTGAVRTVVHVRPGIFVIRDTASARDAHVYEYNLHCEKPGVFDEKAQTMTAKMPKAECLVKFFGKTPWKFRSFDKFPIAPQRDARRPYPEQWHFVASAPAAEKELDLITVLMPYRTGEQAKLPKVEKIADGVRFTYADGHTATVRFVGNRIVTERK